MVPLLIIVTYKYDVIDRWMSEKFDGIRAYWTGRRMYSRSGKEIQIPQFFYNKLPRYALDGELW